MGTYNQALNDNIDNLKVNDEKRKTNEEMIYIEENYIERPSGYDSTHFTDMLNYETSDFVCPEDGLLWLFHGANTGNYYCYFNIDNLAHNWSHTGAYAITTSIQVFKGQKIRVTQKTGSFALRYLPCVYVRESARNIDTARTYKTVSAVKKILSSPMSVDEVVSEKVTIDKPIK